MLTRWKCTLEYDGSDFAGWQRQDNVPSVQQCVEDAITGFCQQNISIHAAGRTDAGVHACGQVIHFDLDYGDRPLEGYELSKALNAHLRHYRISILSVEKVADDFHARFHATNKLYRYRIINRRAPLALDQGRAWNIHKPLNAEAMHEAAQILVGHHDFTSFRSTHCQAKNPVRTLDRLDVMRHGDEIHMEAEGQSFLHHQVRNMIGTFVLVGEGKWSIEDVRTALYAKDRTKAGPTAPAEGLYLVHIDY